MNVCCVQLTLFQSIERLTYLCVCALLINEQYYCPSLSITRDVRAICYYSPRLQSRYTHTFVEETNARAFVISFFLTIEANF